MNINKINRARRTLLSLGAATIGLTLLPKSLLAAQPLGAKLSASRTLYIKAINLNETIRSTYFDGKEYIAEELDKLNHLFRDRRSNEVLEIDERLYDQLYQLQNYFGHDKAIALICGYRSPVTNKNLKKTNTGVADKSYHISGQAVDFYIESVPLKMVQEAALAMKSGGVGYYPKSNFVHIDTGPVRFWPKSSLGPDEGSTEIAAAQKKSAASISPSITKVSSKSSLKNSVVKRMAP